MKYLRRYVRAFDEETITEIKDILQDLFDEFGLVPSDIIPPVSNEYFFIPKPKEDQNWGCYINPLGSKREDEFLEYLKSHIVPRIEFLGIKAVVNPINAKELISSALDYSFIGKPLNKKDRFSFLGRKKTFYIYVVDKSTQDTRDHLRMYIQRYESRKQLPDDKGYLLDIFSGLESDTIDVDVKVTQLAMANKLRDERGIFAPSIADIVHGPSDPDLGENISRILSDDDIRRILRRQTAFTQRGVTDWAALNNDIRHNTQGILRGVPFYIVRIVYPMSHYIDRDEIKNLSKMASEFGFLQVYDSGAGPAMNSEFITNGHNNRILAFYHDSYVR